MLKMYVPAMDLAVISKINFGEPRFAKVHAFPSITDTCPMSKNDKAVNGVGFDSYDHQVSRRCTHKNKSINCFIDIICLCASWKSSNPPSEA